MDEDCRSTSGILIQPLGVGPGDVAPKGPNSIFFKHSRVAYQIEGNEE